MFCGACGAARALLEVEAAIDAAPLRHLEVDARGLFRVRLLNRGAAIADAVLSLTIDRRPLAPTVIGPIVAHGEALAIAWYTPDTAGFHELAGSLIAHAPDGASTTWRITPQHLRADGDKAPVSITIDQSHARVVDNSRSNFGVGPSGGLVGDAEWQPLTLISEVVTPSASAPPPRATPKPVAFSVTTARAAYDLSETIGNGDIATVFGGRVRGQDTAIALKLADDRADNDLIQHELDTLTLLRAAPAPSERTAPTQHLPLAIDQMKTADGRLGTVFERVDGIDLVELRRRLPDGVPPRHLIWIMRRALAVLGWAHQCGVLHGNLDPAHIMVRPRDHMLWLVDWSWAVVNPALTGQGFKALNEIYSPPEVAERKPPLPASDLYSLGKCMIFAAGGDPTTRRLPDMDERLSRFLRFMTLDSALGRPQDAWQTYLQVERLREQIWGAHTFVAFDVPEY